MRDDFSPKTKEIIAKRVGYLCSYPECRKPTVGAALGHDRFLNIGVAAHITAAAPGGPRYNPSLTPDQRKHQSNGIWACEDHAKLIDSDRVHFTVEMLRRWKQAAEIKALLAIAAPHLTLGQRISPSASDTLESELKQLGLKVEDYFESVIIPLITAAKSDLAMFKRLPGWPHHVIALNLRISDGDYTQTFNASGLAAAIETFNEIVIIAPPGTGKTTTLLQLAEAILSQDNSVAVFIPLSEWSSQTDSFFQSILRRRAFAGVQEEHLVQLAHHGRFVLILDGWNELDAASRKRAYGEISKLQREFPDLGIVISTRRQAQDVPIPGPRVEIDALSEDQQMEIAHSLRGSEGETILDHAWRTPGIRDLVAIPLYLTALISQTPGVNLPTTKEEVIRLFVNEHERVPDRADILREELLGFHPNMLEAIAVETTSLATSGASEEQARRVISQVSDQLIHDGQLTTAPQPMKVLDVLVSHHTLVRSSTGTRVISFQHQQIQEWYASFEVERLMKAAAIDNQEAKHNLRANVLNVPPWEEAILFACERLSRSDESGMEAVATAILETIGIDPMLAAEMIYRSSAEVWDKIKEKVLTFVGRWHVAGKVDRAVRFMINSGRSDFSPQIWPLISNQDDQVHLAALRAGRRLRPSVLGTDIEVHIAKLPEVVRKNIISSFAYDGDMDGIELAARLAQVDPSPGVQVSVIEGLWFRRANRFVAEVLRTAPDEVWQLLARKGFAEEIEDPDALTRLQRERDYYIESQTDPLSKLSMLFYTGRPKRNMGPDVMALIEANDFPVKNQNALSIIYQSHKLYPEEVISALFHRLEAGREIPFQTEGLLVAARITIDEGRIVEIVNHPDNLEKVAESAICIVGPKTLGNLIDSLFEMDAKLRKAGWSIDDPIYKEYNRLFHWFPKTNLNSFIQAVINRSTTYNPNKIAFLADLISRHGKEIPKEPIKLDGEVYIQMIAAIERWAKILLACQLATRAQFANVASAIERIAAIELLPVLQRLLAEDLERWRRARNEFFAARNQGIQLPVPSEVSHSWTVQYRRAFSAIGGEEVVELMKVYLPDTEFGLDAAYVLQANWDHEHNPSKEKQIKFGLDFSDVKARREERQRQGDYIPSSPYADAILSVIDKLLKPDSNFEEQRCALQLAKIAFSMPYGNKAATIEALLKLPQSISTEYPKLELVTILVLSGEIISAEIVMDRIKSNLKESEAKKWMPDEDIRELENWLELLPFSDQPEAIPDVLELLEPNFRQAWRLSNLLSALGYAPDPKAKELLKVLPQIDVRILEEHGWLAAIDKQGVSGAKILFDLICEGAFDGKPEIKNKRSFSLILADAMGADTDFRANVYKQYECLPIGQSKNILEEAIAQAADTEGVLILVRSYAEQGKPASYLHFAIEHVAKGRRPSTDWAGSTEVLSVPVPELRMRLFAMTKDDTAEARLASACLTFIDELRDEYGPAESEPRHPDIGSGRPWPLEAGEA